MPVVIDEMQVATEPTPSADTRSSVENQPGGAQKTAEADLEGFLVRRAERGARVRAH